MTMSPPSSIATVFALLVAVPVGLGFLLRLLIRTPGPRLVALLGAAMMLAVAYAAGDRGAGSQFSGRTTEGVTLPVAVAVQALGLLFSILLAFLLVRVGVSLADRWHRVRACRIPNPQAP